MSSGASFPRRVRLTGRNAFASVFAQPVKSGDRYFTVLARANALSHPRLGLTISRKVARSAVVRNRIKRLVRESLRQHQQLLGGFDCVVMGRPKITAVQDNAVLTAALQQHWQKLARLRVPS
jgi:ribonuclease P protein component